jgi:hypothetical protein
MPRGGHNTRSQSNNSSDISSQQANTMDANQFANALVAAIAPLVQAQQQNNQPRAPQYKSPNVNSFEKFNFLNPAAPHYVTNISHVAQEFYDTYKALASGFTTSDCISFFVILLEPHSREKYTSCLLSEPLVDATHKTYFLDSHRPARPAIGHDVATFEQWLNKAFASLAREKDNYSKHQRLQASNKTFSPGVIGTAYRNLIKNSVNADQQHKVTEQNAVQVLYEKIDPRLPITATGTTAFKEFNAKTINFEVLVTRLDDEGTRLGIKPSVADGSILNILNLNEVSPSSDTFEPYWHDSDTASSSVGNNIQINFAGISLSNNEWSEVYDQICNFEETYDDGYYTDDDEECVMLTNFRNNKKIECWNCGKEGHISPDCPEKKGSNFRNKNFNSPRQKRFNNFKKSYPKDMFRKQKFNPRNNKGRTKFRPRRKFFRAKYKKPPTRSNRAHFISDDIHSLEECQVDAELESGYIYFFGDESENGTAFHPLGYVTA